MHPAVPGAFSVHSRKTIKVLLSLALGRVTLALLTVVISLLWRESWQCLVHHGGPSQRPFSEARRVRVTFFQHF